MKIYLWQKEATDRPINLLKLLNNLYCLFAIRIRLNLVSSNLRFDLHNMKHSQLITYLSKLFVMKHSF